MSLKKNIPLKKNIIKYSFFVGCFLFIINFLFLLTDSIWSLYLFCHILPGFIYATLLYKLSNQQFSWKHFLFIALSGLVFIMVARVSERNIFHLMDTRPLFPVASTTGSVLFFIVYFIFINNNMPFLKGILQMAIIGFCAPIIPFFGMMAIQLTDSLQLKSTLYNGCRLLIFPFWQTLFAWVLVRLQERYLVNK